MGRSKWLKSLEGQIDPNDKISVELHLIEIIIRALAGDSVPELSHIQTLAAEAGDQEAAAFFGGLVNKTDIINDSQQNLNFSTEEIDTGKKWIDGKSIYRKVITFVNIPVGIANIDSISDVDSWVDFSGIIEITAGGNGVGDEFPSGYGDGTQDNYFAVFGDKSNNEVNTIMRGFGTTNSGYAIVEYTKNQP